MPKPRPMLDQVSQARLGWKLRTMYDALPDAPIPAQLRDLIDALEGTGLSTSTERPVVTRAGRLSGVPQHGLGDWQRAQNKDRQLA